MTGEFMFNNYLKIALRLLIRHKVFSFINIFGLAVGMACTILIIIWVVDELSYDTFLPNAGNIYRVNTELKFGGIDSDMPLSSDMMGPTLKQDYPQLKEFTRIYAFSAMKLVKRNNDFFTENKTMYADSTFFSVFNFPAIAGNTQSALNQPNTVVINESTAKKYFGKIDVIGKTIETKDNNGPVFKITAVIKDMPVNSHFNFDFIFPMQNLNFPFGNYMSTNFYTYLLLQDGTDYKGFENNLDQYILKHAWPYAQKLIKIGTIDEFEKGGNKIKYSLTPLSKIHLYSNRQFELGVNGSIQYVYIFSTIALFILLIASVNFMNLTTARSANRAREVGIRKVLGTERKNLIIQFLAESVLLTYLSMVAAIGLVYFLLPLFNSISGKNLLFAKLLSLAGLIIILLLPLVVGVLAGSYPALILSGFKPIMVLKGKLLSGKKGKNVRGALVVFQFAASIVLIIATLIIYKQLNYVQNKNLGYNKDQVLIIDDTYALKNDINAFKTEMLQVKGVRDATITGFLPIPSARNGNTFFKDVTMDMKGGLNIQRWDIDYNYIDFMGMKISKGRNFSKEFGTDTSAIIINEAAARLLGYNNPIGEKLYTFAGSDLKNHFSYNIIGVVKDFHFESLKQPIGPLSFLLRKNNGACSFRVDASNIASILKQAENKWKSMAQDKPFNYRFMDESFDEMYKAERNIGLTAVVSALFAVLVACLGLFGLSIFMSQQKTKEIGIRKTLGASVPVILLLLMKEFLKWLILANLIAWPIAYYFMNKWLEDFAYRIDISWWMFVLSGGIALVIALVTVSFQAIKAAIANPVESLRYE
jgi:putative ABC transport system permease protein